MKEEDFMIKEIEEYALNNNIPIMQQDGISFLTNYIKEHNIKTILEIGSAIGYSAIKMACVDKNIHVTTIEKDELRYTIAVNNINKINMNNQITIYLDDALEVNLPNNKYDLIFIDAAKGKYIEFFNIFSCFLERNGVIVTDNIDFHGLVKDSSLIETKNQRKIVEKIKKYIQFLEENIDYNTTYYNVGDGITVSKRKDDGNEVTS